MSDGAVTTNETADKTRGLRTSDFDYHLPDDRIAQTPLEPRDAARMLVVNRATESLRHRHVRDLPDLLRSGDLLVVNNTRVMAARLLASRVPTGGRVELLLLRHEHGEWSALARPARRLRAGDQLRLLDGAINTTTNVRVTVVARGAEGTVRLRFDPNAPGLLEQFGEVPLPPYIRAPLNDAGRYQTTYATVVGSAAAPTAGLHLTTSLLQRLEVRGVEVMPVTLHIGLDTFRPVTAELVADHVIHREWCTVPDATATRILAAKDAGRRVVAVGTTTVRTLETLGERWESGEQGGFTGTTGLFIRPGYRWRIVDALMTNFHLPRTSLLMMICAFGGQHLVMRAYQEAIETGYRFYSFGDAMLVE